MRGNLSLDTCDHLLLWNKSLGNPIWSTDHRRRDFLTYALSYRLSVTIIWSIGVGSRCYVAFVLIRNTYYSHCNLFTPFLKASLYETFLFPWIDVLSPTVYLICMQNFLDIWSRLCLHSWVSALRSLFSWPILPILKSNVYFVARRRQCFSWLRKSFKKWYFISSNFVKSLLLLKIFLLWVDRCALDCLIKACMLIAGCWWLLYISCHTLVCVLVHNLLTLENFFWRIRFLE